jgi:glycosyltransferase involved in cell wall biosynthesis
VPKVSILFTCYNHLRFISEALESARSQTFRDFEIIALDDGSTDGTREWLSEQRDVRVIFNEQNLGTYATLNVGLQHASGEYVAVLNDDDAWAPRKLEAPLELFESHPSVGLCHTGGIFIDDDSRTIEGAPLGFPYPTFDTGDMWLKLIYENRVIASAAMVRRECFDRLGGFNEAYFGLGDWEMWLRIAEQYDLGFVDESLTIYRVHVSNASRQSTRMWEDGERLRDWLIARLDAMKDRYPAAELAHAQARNFAALGVLRTLNGHPAAGRRAFAQAIRLEPRRVKSYLRYGSSFLPQAMFRKTIR